MIAAVLPSKKARVALLAVFALLLSLVGVSATADSARAVTTYGGVRVVDNAGDPVSAMSLSIVSDGLWHSYTTDAQGVVRLTDASPWTEVPVSLTGTVVAQYGIGGPIMSYGWYGGGSFEPASDAVAATAEFVASSNVLLELTLPVYQPTGSISGTVRLNPAAPSARIASVSLIGDTEYQTLARMFTDANGHYTFTGVPAGSYRIAFDSYVTSASSPDGYIRSFYASSDFASATLVNVDDMAVTGIDQTLVAYGRVQGVLGTAADDLDWPAVAFYPATWDTPDWDSPEITWVRPLDGLFDTRFEPGSYRVAFGDRVTGESLGEWEWDYDFTPVEYWGGTSAANSRLLLVAPGQSKTVNGLNPPLFTDVAVGSQFEFQIAWLASTGVTTGYPDGGFHPLGTVNRDAMAAFLYRFAGSPPFSPPADSPFTDVPKSNQFFKEITWLAASGITTGYPDGTFRPLATVNRDAMAAFLYRFVGSPTWTPPGKSPFTDVGVSSQFFAEITWLSDTSITTGYPDGTYRPLATVNRDAMAAFLYRLEQSGRWS